MPATLEPVSIQTESPQTPQKSGLRVGFVSLGCPKNLVDSEVMMGLLQHGGAQLTSDAATADILVVNTCSFIDSAKQESVDTILEMARHKTEGRVQKLIVAGCLVERYRDEIRAQIPEVDAVVGTGELDAILAAAGLSAPAAAGSSLVQISGAVEPAFRAEGNRREQQGRFDRTGWDGATAPLPTYLYDEATPRVRATQSATAYIKIAEGCDHPCSFCIIPQLRGKFRSRRVESVVREAEQLLAQGVREIVLIGQDTTCYGEDLGLKDGLALLLESLAVLPGLKWLRFLYAYPNRVTDKLLGVMAAHENICPYLDVPLQHASANTLKTMRRGGSDQIFLRMLDRARSHVPNITLRTSFIVGFPGETEQDFQTLKQFVTDGAFDWMGVFTYSDEEGAHAHGLGGKVPQRTRQRRERELMEHQRAISAARKQAMVGKKVEVLVEGPSSETDLLWEGRTAAHAPGIDGKVYINDFGELDALVPGSFYRCEITEAHDYDLVARVVAASE